MVTQTPEHEVRGLAAARGLPAVAGGEGGAREAVCQGRTGLVLDDPRDADALAGALDTLLADPALRRRYGAAARAGYQSASRPEHLGARVLQALGLATAAA